MEVISKLAPRFSACRSRTKSMTRLRIAREAYAMKRARSANCGRFATGDFQIRLVQQRRGADRELRSAAAQRTLRDLAQLRVQVGEKINARVRALRHGTWVPRFSCHVSSPHSVQLLFCRAVCPAGPNREAREAFDFGLNFNTADIFSLPLFARPPDKTEKHLKRRQRRSNPRSAPNAGGFVRAGAS